MRISDWSSDVCSSDLAEHPVDFQHQITQVKRLRKDLCLRNGFSCLQRDGSKSSDEHDAHFRRNGGDMLGQLYAIHLRHDDIRQEEIKTLGFQQRQRRCTAINGNHFLAAHFQGTSQIFTHHPIRSEHYTSEPPSLILNSYDVS